MWWVSSAVVLATPTAPSLPPSPTVAEERAADTAARAAKADGAVAVQVDPSTGRQVAYFGSDHPLPSLAGNGVVDRRSLPYTAARYNEFLEDIVALAHVPGTLNSARYPYSTEIDPASGMVVVRTEAPPEDIAILNSRFPGMVQFYKGGPRSVAGNRNADTAPHYAGSTITSGPTLCSAGMVVSIPGLGQRMVTAGHCGPVNSQWRNGTGANPFGVISHNSFTGGSWDQALINNTSSARIWAGGTAATSYYTQLGPGANATAAGTYYTSARSGTVGHALFTASSGPITIAYPGGDRTYTGLTILTVAVPGGDSGGVLHGISGTTARPRGIVLAALADPGRIYVEPWTRISALWGASVVSG